MEKENQILAVLISCFSSTLYPKTFKKITGISTTPSCSNVFSWGFADTDTSIGNDTAYILDWVSASTQILYHYSQQRTVHLQLNTKSLKEQDKKVCRKLEIFW